MFLFVVCFCACIAGAICGIGGGVIIKPVLDAAGTMDLVSINFLSGCTVLSMTAYSVGRSKLTGSSRLDLRVSVPLAVGAAVGGVLGKLLFQVLRARSANPGRVGAVQAGCLLFLTVVTLLYTLKKSKIHTYRMEKWGVCLLIGFLLGMLSSFLGIGGGPVNLVVLFYFFSMDTKTAAENSISFFFHRSPACSTALRQKMSRLFPYQRWPSWQRAVSAGVFADVVSTRE